METISRYQKGNAPANTAAKTVQIKGLPLPPDFRLARPISVPHIASRFPFPDLEKWLSPGASCIRPAVLRRDLGISAMNQRARLAAGSAAAFPLLARHSCHATSIGEATAIDE